MDTKNYRHDFAFIIPTLTNVSGLKKILALIGKFYPKTPVVVVNNNPANIIRTKNITVINNQKNEGVPKSLNQGARRARELFHPTYLVFLNDDVEFDSDWLSSCFETLKRNGWVATSPVLMKPDYTIENCGYMVLPYGKVKLTTDIKNTEKIDGISGTAMVFETNGFFRLGGFDERFFAYLEDVDLFLRAKKKGYSFGITKDAKVTHMGQVTSSRFKTKKAYLDFRNWILVIAKNWSREDLMKNLGPILIERFRNLWGIVKTLV
ncbi:glycosyltransferase [Candidatus Roizmanbacteria bacterium]|nr:glycosyltransferase [Candidatus Roizmanbacteria bacterium]